MGFFDMIKNAVSNIDTEKIKETATTAALKGAEMTGKAVGTAKRKYDEYEAQKAAERQAQMQAQAQRQAQMNQPLFSERPATGLALAIGVTTGELYARGHQIGLAGNQWVWLKDDDACQNIVVMGGIGSGDDFAVFG